MLPPNANLIILDAAASSRPQVRVRSCWNRSTHGFSDMPKYTLGNCAALIEEFKQASWYHTLRQISLSSRFLLDTWQRCDRTLPSHRRVLCNKSTSSSGA